MNPQTLPLGQSAICVRVRHSDTKRVTILTIDVAKTFKKIAFDNSEFERRLPRFRTKEAVVRAFVQHQFKKAFGQDVVLKPRRSAAQ